MPVVPTNFSYLPVDTPGTSLSPLRRFAEAVLRAWQLMSQIVNGQISFGNGSVSDNISGVWVSVTFAVANSDQTVNHNLGRVPVGYISMTKSAACDVYTGSIAPTTTQITLRGTTTSTVVLFII